jgi:hypothetical protein
VLSPQTRSLVNGFIVAPLVVPIVFVALKGISQGFDRSSGLLGWLMDAAAGFAMFSVFAYLAAIAIGVPMLLLYRKLHIRSIMAYAVGGLVVSIAAMFAISAITGGFGRSQLSAVTFFQSMVVLVLSGAASGVVFHLVAFHRAD